MHPTDDMHLTDETIDHLVHDELSAAEHREARSHLSTCAVCRRREVEMTAEDREIAGALAVLDRPSAAVNADAIVRRARRGRGRWRLAVAGSALLAATAAAAMPGSPVRRWLFEESDRPVAAPEVVAPVIAEEQSAAERGVAMVPGDSADVVFDARQESGEIAIRIVAGRELRVRAIGGSAGFVVRPGGVRVRNDGSRASYELLVPAALGRMRVTVAGRELFARRTGDAADSVTLSFATERR
jgi:hypothetical protein